MLLIATGADTTGTDPLAMWWDPTSAPFAPESDAITIQPLVALALGPVLSTAKAVSVLQ